MSIYNTQAADQITISILCTFTNENNKVGKITCSKLKLLFYLQICELEQDYITYIMQNNLLWLHERYSRPISPSESVSQTWFWQSNNYINPKFHLA